MHKWTEKWLLNFHPGKCKSMRIRRSDINEHNYKMIQELSTCTKEKDIGVIIDNKLTFSDHLAEKVNKANRLVGMMRRTSVSLDCNMFKSLYTSLVRPHLEYANQVWNPHLVKDIEAMERVQKRTTKMLPGMKDLPYEQRQEA